MRCCCSNVLLSGCRGCHLADRMCDWIVSSNDSAHEGAVCDGDDDKVDEALVVFLSGSVEAVGAPMQHLIAMNRSSDRRAAYISMTSRTPRQLQLYGRNRRALEVGEAWMLPSGARGSGELVWHECITFVVTLEPRASITLGELDSASLACGTVGLSKLSFRLKRHPGLLRGPRPPYRLANFPLGGDGPYLCTQGVGGGLTHFFPESYHAFDLQCPENTEVLAVVDGRIGEVHQTTQVSGIHAFNLMAWNSISVETACGITIEYLHIAPGSCVVEVGDRVHAGQVVSSSTFSALYDSFRKRAQQPGP